ncbi:hypothetical protein F5X68DRAFT_212521 [Plectosphaerella plurivora]|uniref:Uncharacterized protein n=1 Tax=Plectosphaerella plurivora TaxID=936078 RepID=A0A9P9A696_9PEZI|nr:hypothetical protein F5X68DRAFT_212521 [Plectosphaerella plurivora]
MATRRRPPMPAHAHSALMETAAIVSALPLFVRDALAPATDTLRSIGASSLPHASASLPRLWTLSKPSLFSHGCGRALVYLLLGILVNHVRRTLWPWLGGDLHYAPLGDLKLAIGSPHVFLGEVLGRGWGERIGMMAWKMGVDVLGAFAVGVLVEEEKKKEEEESVRIDVARVGAVVYMLSAVEYVHARTCHTVAVILACIKGLVPLPKTVWGIGGGGTEAHRAAHWEVLRGAGSAARTAVACRMVVYIMYALGPMVIGAMRGVAAGRPGMGMVMVGVGYVTYVVTRWSNKYYMLLEMWGMVMVLGWAAVAGVVVVREAWASRM